MAQEEVERSVLGGILLDDRLYKEAAELLPDDFSLDSHRSIFARMGDLAAAARPIDILTVVEELERHKELQSVGARDTSLAWWMAFRKGRRSITTFR